MPNVTFSVFTKPWKKESADELGAKVSKMGFTGVEYALRDGYQLEPKDAANGLKPLSETFKKYGVKITSVASVLTEEVFAGCSAAGVPLIRIMAGGNDPDFAGLIAKTKEELTSKLPLCEKYGVKIGIQHHFGYGVNNSMELFELIREYDPKFVGAIWDAAHSALAGEEPEQALSILASHMCLVNLKNVIYVAKNGPEACKTIWDRHFTTGSRGISDWERIANALRKRGYEGVICLTAEYTDEANVDDYVARDIAYAKKLFGMN